MLTVGSSGKWLLGEENCMERARDGWPFPGHCLGGVQGHSQSRAVSLSWGAEIRLGALRQRRLWTQAPEGGGCTEKELQNSIVVLLSLARCGTYAQGSSVKAGRKEGLQYCESLGRFGLPTARGDTLLDLLRGSLAERCCLPNESQQDRL